MLHDKKEEDKLQKKDLDIIGMFLEFNLVFEGLKVYSPEHSQTYLEGSFTNW